MFAAGGGCFGAPRSSGGPDSRPARASDLARRYALDSLPQATITAEQHTLQVWLVQEFDDARPGAVQEGLMHVPPEEIGDDQGMLFVFSDERVRGFWMLNTITPLDIAFARYDGTIVKTWSMPPLTIETFSSLEPAMFALEVKQGRLAALGIEEGDQLILPPEVFKVVP